MKKTLMTMLMLGVGATSLAANAQAANTEITTLNARGWTCAANNQSESKNCYDVARHFCQMYKFRGASRFRLERARPGKVGRYRWVVCYR